MVGPGGLGSWVGGLRRGWEGIGYDRPRADDVALSAESPGLQRHCELSVAAF